MNDITTGTATELQVYNAENSGTITNTICVLLPRAIVTAGFDNKGKLCTAEYAGYGSEHAVWNPDFFAHRFLTNDLLSNHKQLSAIFFACEKHLLVPGVLYNEGSAANWLNMISQVSKSETIEAYYLRQDDIHYVYAISAAIKKLSTTYFDKTPALPFAVYQFSKGETTGHVLQCCVTDSEAYATLYHNGSLQWHRAFHYTKADDIAYSLHQLCNEIGIPFDKLQMQCTCIAPHLADVVAELGTYFPNMSKPGNTWSYTIPLLQQLQACV